MPDVRHLSLRSNSLFIAGARCMPQTFRKHFANEFLKLMSLRCVIHWGVHSQHRHRQQISLFAWKLIYSSLMASKWTICTFNFCQPPHSIDSNTRYSIWSGCYVRCRWSAPLDMNILFDFWIETDRPHQRLSNPSPINWMNKNKSVCVVALVRRFAAALVGNK